MFEKPRFLIDIQKRAREKAAENLRGAIKARMEVQNAEEELAEAREKFNRLPGIIAAERAEREKEAEKEERRFEAELEDKKRGHEETIARMKSEHEVEMSRLDEKLRRIKGEK